MRKGLKRSGILLVAIGILALAYHFGSQTGPSIPFEPTSYEPADLAPPTPIVVDNPMPDSVPKVPDTNDLGKPSFVQPVSSLSPRVRIISVNAAPLAPVESKPNPGIVETKPVALEGEQMKSTPGIIPEKTQEESPAPAPSGPRRRAIDDGEVAWHVITTPGDKTSPSAERIFPEPGSNSPGSPYGVISHEMAKPAMTTTMPPAPVESARHKEDTPPNPKAVSQPKQPASPYHPMPVLRPRKDKPAETGTPERSPISGPSRPRFAEDAAPPVSVNTAPPVKKPIPQESKPESKTKLNSLPVTPQAPPPGPIPDGKQSSVLARSPNASIAALSPKPSVVARISDVSVAARSADQSVVARPPEPTVVARPLDSAVVARSADRDARPESSQPISEKGRPKIKIIGLYPKPPEAKTAEKTTKPTIPEPATKLAAAVPVVQTQSSLPPVRARIESLQTAPDFNRPKTKITELPPVPLESKAPSWPAKSNIQQVVALAPANPPTNSVKLAVIRNGQSVPEKAKTGSAEKPKPSIERVVSLPPAELPASVRAEATEFATQKLMARSLSSQTGVAARLAHAKVGSSVLDGSELILAGGLMDHDGSAFDEGNPQAYSTTGVVQLTASKEEIAAKAHLDYVTSGTVILGEPEEPTITRPASVQERTLKNVIRAACGTRIDDLEVTLESDHTLRIRLKAPRGAEQELRQTIMALPELTDFKVQLKIHID